MQLGGTVARALQPLEVEPLGGGQGRVGGGRRPRAGVPQDVVDAEVRGRLLLGRAPRRARQTRRGFRHADATAASCRLLRELLPTEPPEWWCPRRPATVPVYA